MSTRAAPSRSSAGRQSARQPKGARLPAPGAALQAVRCLVLACTLLALALPHLHRWADVQLTNGASEQASAHRLPHVLDLPPAEIALALLLHWLDLPPQRTFLQVVAAATIALIACELLANLLQRTY